MPHSFATTGSTALLVDWTKTLLWFVVIKITRVSSDCMHEWYNECTWIMIRSGCKRGNSNCVCIVGPGNEIVCGCSQGTLPVGMRCTSTFYIQYLQLHRSYLISISFYMQHPFHRLKEIVCKAIFMSSAWFDIRTLSDVTAKKVKSRGKAPPPRRTGKRYAGGYKNGRLFWAREWIYA